jgi:hypothetical protein
MPTITGARGTGNISADQRTIDMGQRITLLEPDASPLTVLSKRIRTERALDPKFNWLEDSRDPRFSATSGAVTNVATTVPVTTGQGSYFQQYTLAQNTRTGEIFRVTSVATDNLTVVRGVGAGGTGVAMNSGDELLILATAQPEGDTSKPARSNNAAKQTNYTEIFRTEWEVTGTNRRSTQQVTPSDWDLQAKKKGIEHAVSIEYALLFGKPSEDLTGAQPLRTTGGALYYIVSNTTAVGGTLTEATFNTAVRKGFRYSQGNRRKVLLASGLVLQAINQFAQNKLQIRQGEDTYGLSVMTYVTPFGKLDLIVHWLLEGTVYGGYGIGLDLDQIAWRPLISDQESGETHVRQNIQARDADSRKDEYLTEAGEQFGQEKMHFVLTGITG